MKNTYINGFYYFGALNCHTANHEGVLTAVTVFMFFVRLFSF